MVGSVVCSAHGGLAPQTRATATRREVERRAEAMVDRLNVEPLDSPVDQLMRLSAETLALRDWLSQQFNQADNDSAFLLAEALGRGLDRASKLLIEIHRLGLEERRVALEEGLARLLADVVRGVLVDVGVDPDDPEVRGVVRRHFERAAHEEVSS